MNDQYPELYHSYQWWVPSQFNIAQACLYRWAGNPSDARRTALIHHGARHDRQTHTYAQLALTTSQLANGLQKMGVQPGDRVALLMGQSPKCAAALMAILATGAIAVPFTTNLTTPELSYCLNNSGVRVAIADKLSLPGLVTAQSHCPQLGQIISADIEHELAISWRTLLARQTGTFTPVATRSSSPALLLYGKQHQGENLYGVSLAHGTLIGNLPGFVCVQNWCPVPGDIFWTPHDWRSASGLLNALLPAMYFGVPLLSTEAPVSPDAALDLILNNRITNILISTQALNRVLGPYAKNAITEPLVLPHLRAIALEGKDPAGTTSRHCRHVLGVMPNAFFSTPETGCVIAQSHEKWPTAPGSCGRPVPGHRIAVLDSAGLPCPPGHTGQLAVATHDIHDHPDPALFSGYWADPTAQDTTPSNVAPWHLTHDYARIDTQGNVWLQNKPE